MRSGPPNKRSLRFVCTAWLVTSLCVAAVSLALSFAADGPHGIRIAAGKCLAHGAWSHRSPEVRQVLRSAEHRLAGLLRWEISSRRSILARGSAPKALPPFHLDSVRRALRREAGERRSADPPA